MYRSDVRTRLEGGLDPRPSPTAGPGTRLAAVLLPLVDDRLVLTRRTEHLSRHPWEISFPGGRQDAGEPLWDTALREADEEIGLKPELVRMVGALPPTGTFVTNYAVYPFVGLIEPGFAWLVQEAEVAYVLELPLEAVRAAHAERRLVRRGVPFRTDTYQVGDHLIWGATARMVRDLLARLTPHGGTP